MKASYQSIIIFLNISSFLLLCITFIYYIWLLSKRKKNAKENEKKWTKIKEFIVTNKTIPCPLKEQNKIDALLPQFCLSWEPEFEDKMKNWTEESLDNFFYLIGTYYCLKSNDGNNFFEENNEIKESIFNDKKILKERVWNYYDDTIGSFRQTYSSACSIYANFCFAGIILDILRLREKRDDSIAQATDKDVLDILGLSNGEWCKAKEKINKFIRKSKSVWIYDSNCIGFRENPSTAEHPTLTITSSALRLMFIFSLIDKNNDEDEDLLKKSANFIHKCMIKTDKILAFSSRPGDIKSVMCGTGFIIRTLQSARYKELNKYFIEVGILDELGIISDVDENNKNKTRIIEFVKECWDATIGGFRIFPQKREIPTIIQTKLALNTLYRIDRENLTNNIEQITNLSLEPFAKKIIEFLNLCRYKNNKHTSYYFAPKNYLPNQTINLCATRNAVEIVNLLVLAGSKLAEEYRKENWQGIYNSLSVFFKEKTVEIDEEKLN